MDDSTEVMVRLPLVLNPTYILPNSRKNLNENIFNIIEPLNNKLHGLLPPWWFRVSPWQVCITLFWPRSSLKLTATSSRSTFWIIRYLVSQLLDVAFFFVLQPNDWRLNNWCCTRTKLKKQKQINYNPALIKIWGFEPRSIN